MRRFLVVIEQAPGNYSAYSPDLPGCIATGSTKTEALERMRRAVALHLKGLKQDGLLIPEPTASAEYIAAPEPA